MLLCTVEGHSSLAACSPVYNLPPHLHLFSWSLPDGTGDGGLSLQLAVGISKPDNYRSLCLLLSDELPWPRCTFEDAAGSNTESCYTFLLLQKIKCCSIKYK